MKCASLTQVLQFRRRFSEVSTYLNSGNVLFSFDHDNIAELKDKIEEMVIKKFGLSIPVHIIDIVCLKVAEKLTIRTENTLKKLCMSENSKLDTSIGSGWLNSLDELFYK